MPKELSVSTNNCFIHLLPSNAPVERLFSPGGAVLTSKQNRLTDARFEKLLYTYALQ